jgi:hypothetical protein
VVPCSIDCLPQSLSGHVPAPGSQREISVPVPGPSNACLAASLLVKLWPARRHLLLLLPQQWHLLAMLPVGPLQLRLAVLVTAVPRLLQLNAAALCSSFSP